MKAHLNIAGIILTIIGALLIWFLLGEINFAKKDEYLKRIGELEIPNPTPEAYQEIEAEYLPLKNRHGTNSSRRLS